MSIWSSWLYHYGIGGAVAVASLAMLTWAGAIRLGDSHHRWIVLLLVGGLVAFAAAHAAWIATALRGAGS